MMEQMTSCTQDAAFKHGIGNGEAANVIVDLKHQGVTDLPGNRQVQASLMCRRGRKNTQTQLQNDLALA